MKFISIYLIAFTLHFSAFDIEISSENKYSLELEFTPFYDDFGYPQFNIYFLWFTICSKSVFNRNYDIDF